MGAARQGSRYRCSGVRSVWSFPPVVPREGSDRSQMGSRIRRRHLGKVLPEVCGCSTGGNLHHPGDKQAETYAGQYRSRLRRIPGRHSTPQNGGGCRRTTVGVKAPSIESLIGRRQPVRVWARQVDKEIPGHHKSRPESAVNSRFAPLLSSDRPANPLTPCPGCSGIP